MSRVQLTTIIIGLTLSILATTLSYADDITTIQEDVICIMPVYVEGTVILVLATHPCTDLPLHQHVLVMETRAYSLQVLQEGLRKVEIKENVKITGKVEGSEQTGGILYIN